jgi:uncharacterized YccA/Bax inhibitor family protein
MRSSNPILREKAFSVATSGEVMTMQGTVNKAVALLALLVIGGAWTWNLFYHQGIEAMTPWLLGGFGGAFVLALLISFMPRISPPLAPVYAVLEGFLLGGLSAVLEQRYPGVVVQAVGLTVGVFFSLLVAYKLRLVQATAKFRYGVIAATGGVMLIYLVTMIGRFFGWYMPYIHDSGPIGIGFSLVVVVIAALNLVLDFDFIEHGAGRVDKYMEWYAAFGLIVTLAWLYLEILRLLSKLRSR